MWYLTPIMWNSQPLLWNSAANVELTPAFVEWRLACTLLAPAQALWKLWSSFIKPWLSQRNISEELEMGERKQQTTTHANLRIGDLYNVLRAIECDSETKYQAFIGSNYFETCAKVSENWQCCDIAKKIAFLLQTDRLDSCHRKCCGPFEPQFEWTKKGHLQTKFYKFRNYQLRNSFLKPQWLTYEI
uniref:Uncharacterized protein n=1 Tax=Glossina austeni TaxID=7395 RepID=A0A1A9VXE8_GLOAU